ncbi:glutathione S-transferase [Inhella inkyongensis]|uniref:Glutathione S-transferase n=1 Tax=Inhella inkyongensis TaxID=392593 RepID=A0A840S2R4_9BURK|nr:glutathione S-transferase family protein [Inhella inkyongensis]MBB5203376.1 glutathione S-transferase [Inhella inkyongensis]
MLTLYGARDSGHSYKVRLALLMMGQLHRYERIDLGLPRDQRPEPFRTLSPYGEVPLLVHGEQVLAQSNAILLHLVDHADPAGPWAVPESEREMLRRWLFWEANRVGFSVPNLRFSRGWVAQPAAVEQWLEARARADLDTLAQHLSARDWILDGGPSVADLSLCAYLFWLPQAGLQAADWPAVQAWLARIQALPGWQAPEAVL